MTRTVLRSCAVWLLFPVAVLAVACGDSATSPSSTSSTSTTSASSTTPTVPVTETFSGSLASGGTNIHVFHTMPGVFTVTLASTDQPSNPALGMSFGMWDGATCTEVLTTISAIPSTVLTGTASVETDVCIKMSDPTPWDAALVLKYQLSATHFAKSSS